MDFGSLSTVLSKSLSTILSKSLSTVLSKSLSTGLSKRLSRLSAQALPKCVHLLTACVYLFTTVGPSLSHATNTITVADVVEEAPRGLNRQAAAPQEDYKRYDLVLTPKNKRGRRGVHFRFKSYGSPEDSLEAFVNIRGPFPYANFAPLVKKDVQTGFTVSLPGFGRIQCDWKGNLSLVGLSNDTSALPIALALITKGTIDLSDFTFKNLALYGRKATFVKEIDLQGDSVFDVEAFHIGSSSFENNHTMRFRSPTQISSKACWENKGHVIGEKSLFFDGVSIVNRGLVHSQDRLTLESSFFSSFGGRFIGDAGVELIAKSSFLNLGTISSGGTTRVYFEKPTLYFLGKVQGKKVILKDLSGGEKFSINSGQVQGTKSVFLVGKSPQLEQVKFITPALYFLNADSFNIGDQGDVGRTIVVRAKDQSFSLPVPYKTNGSLEFWQKGLQTDTAVKAVMAARFGDEKGQMPAPESLIDLQESVQAAGGLKFFTPFAKVRLGNNEGDETAEAFPEFLLTNQDQTTYGNLTAYVTLFDLEKGGIVAKNAFIHAPGGILTGRLVRDETRDCFTTVGSHANKSSNMAIGSWLRAPKLIYQGKTITGIYNGHHLLTLPISCGNGSMLLFKNKVHLKGPLTHVGKLSANNLILDTPKDSHCTASDISLSGDLQFLQGGDLYLKRTHSLFHYVHGVYGVQTPLHFINSDPAKLTVSGKITGNPSNLIHNEASILHAGEMDPTMPVPRYTDLRSGYYQKFIPKTEFEAHELQNALYTLHGYKTCFECRPNDLAHITFPANYTASEYDGASLLYSWGFLQLTNNFEGAQQAFPAQTSFGTNTFMPADENAMTSIGGRFSTPVLVVSTAEPGAKIGSMTITQEPTRTQLTSLMPASFDSRQCYLTENLKNLMAQKPETDTFFRWRPLYFFERAEAQQFHQRLKPVVRVENRRGGFDELEGQTLFSLSPSMLIQEVQKEALKTLGRGNIDANRPLDEEQIIELHQNFVDYLVEQGEDTAHQLPNTPNSLGPLSLATLEQQGRRPAPTKPCIMYTSTVNEEGVPELSPVIWIPKKMHHDGGIKTQITLMIPAGMTLRDWIQIAQTNDMMREAFLALQDKAPDLFPAIDAAATRYQDRARLLLPAPEEDQTLVDSDTPDQLSPASPRTLEDFPQGDIEFNGKITTDKFFAIATGNIINHADIECQDAFLISLLNDVRLSSEVTRLGNSQNFQDVISAQSRLHAAGVLKIFAGKNVVFEAADTHSELGTHIIALANIFDIPVQLVRQIVQQMEGKYEGTETFTQVHAQTSTHTSGGKFHQQSGDSQILYAPTYEAATLEFEGAGDLTVKDVQTQYIHTCDGKKEGTFKSKTLNMTESSSTSRGATFTSVDQPTLFTSHNKNISLTAPNFKGGHGAIIRSPEGQVEILLGRNTFDVTYNSNSDGMLWKKMVQESESHLTFTLPTTDGPVEIYARETVLQSIQGHKLAFLDDLDVKEGSFINQVIAELHEHHSDVIEGPGMVLAIIVAVVVSCCTGGMGGVGLVGALGSVLTSAGLSATAVGVLSVGFAAAINTSITNHVLDTMAAKGDVFKATEKAFSGKRLKEAGVSGLQAGATKYVGGKIDAFFGDTKSLGFPTTFAKKLTHNIASQTIGSGVDSIVSGTNFQSSFLEGLKTAGVNTVLDTAVEGVTGKMTSTDSAIEIIGHTTAGMVRNFASQSILGDDPRDALVKAIAQGAAELACHGVSGALDSLKDLNSTEAEQLEVEAPLNASPGSARSPDEITASLHTIIDGTNDEANGTTTPAFFGDDGVPPMKPVFDLSDHPSQGSFMSSFDDEIQDTPWLDMDEMFRTSDLGLAYNTHFPLDPLEGSYQLSSLYRDDDVAHWGFKALSTLTEPLREFEDNNPEKAQNIREIIQMTGAMAGAVPRKLVEIFDPEALKTFSEFEKELGIRLGRTIKQFAEKAEATGRTPWEKEQFKRSAFLSAEAACVPLAVLRAGRATKGTFNAVRGKFTLHKVQSSLPQAGNGYHWRMVGDKPSIIRNPGRAADLPQLLFDPHNNVVKLFDIKQNGVMPVKGLDVGRKSGTPLSAFQSEQLKRSLLSEEISQGHAFAKHVNIQGEFPGIGTKKQFQYHIENLLENPTSIHYFRDGRIAYTHAPSKTVIFKNNKAGESTAFKPKNWEKFVKTQLTSRTKT